MSFRAFAGLVAAALIIAVALTFLVPLGAFAAERCGVASYYGEAHHGKTMANGRPFNMHALTAAMWDVPFGTRFIVRNVQNGRSVQIVITDRGPHPRLNRLIDLSKAAAAKLGMIDAGVARVCITRLN
jgi:rare lipoprotein A